MSSSNKERKIYLDILKILAIFLILFNHTRTNGFVLFLEERESFIYWPLMFISIISKIAVPIFLMSSGVVLLGKKESYKELLINRILKYAIILFLFSLLTYSIYTKSFDFLEFFKTLYSSQTVDSYWFLYSYLAFLIVLPFLRMIAEKMKQSDFKYLLIIFLFYSCINVLEFIIWNGEVTFNRFLGVFLIVETFFYPLVGYFIENKLDKKYLSKDRLIKLIVISIFAIILTCLLTNYRCTILNIWNEEGCQFFYNTFIFIPAITLFCCVKRLFEHISIKDKIQTAIVNISKCVFIIYLVEPLLLIFFDFLYDYLPQYIGNLGTASLLILCEFTVGLVIGLLLYELIRLIKKEKLKSSN